MARILDVDLLSFERGDRAARSAVVDGVMESLRTGFVYTSHDIGEDLLDTAYGMLAEFFSMDPATKSRFVAPGLVPTNTSSTTCSPTARHSRDRKSVV